MSIDETIADVVDDVVKAAPTAVLHTAGEVGFVDRVRSVNTECAMSPAAVISCTDPKDWARVLVAAHEAGHPIAIRGGGWSPAGLGNVDGGLVLSLDQQRDTTWLDDYRIRVGGGVLSGQAERVLGDRGRAMTLPVPSGPGLVGAALSGGVGFTLRKLGFVCDSLEAVTLATATGEILDVDDHTHPDLMWALRGGGSNFGLVTDAVFRTHALTQVTVSQQIFPLASAERALRFHSRWTSDLSADITIVLMLRNAPPAPGVPESTVGRPALVLTAVHCGDLADAVRDLAPLEALKGSVFARHFVTSLVDLRAMTEATFVYDQFGIRTSSGLTGELDNADVNNLLAMASTLPPGDAIIEVAALGGSLNQPAFPSAASGREASHLVNLLAIWVEDRQRESTLAWFTEARAVLGRLRADKVVLPGFADVEDLDDPAGYGTAYERLVEVKRRYDPDNTFNRNLNVSAPVSQ